MLPILTLILAQQVIPLRPVPADTTGETMVERGNPAEPDRAITHVLRPDLTVYLPDPARATGRAVIICPGGAYMRLAIDKEGYEVARWLQSLGHAAFVLKYRLPGSMNGTMATVAEALRATAAPLEDAQEAMRVVRRNAQKWGLKANGVGMMGFSAGGNLAALMGVTAPAETRPDFLVLVYPAIPQELGDIPETMPPTFLVHADDDRLAAGDNSVRFYLAMKKAKRPAELHVYATGGHGFGIRKTTAPTAAWPAALETWLKGL